MKRSVIAFVALFAVGALGGAALVAGDDGTPICEKGGVTQYLSIGLLTADAGYQTAEAAIDSRRSELRVDSSEYVVVAVEDHQLLPGNSFALQKSGKTSVVLTVAELSNGRFAVTGTTICVEDPSIQGGVFTPSDPQLDLKGNANFDSEFQDNYETEDEYNARTQGDK